MTPGDCVGCGVALGWWVFGPLAAATAAVAFLLRARLPAGLVTALLAGGGAGATWAGMSLRPAPEPAETWVAVVAMAVLVPAHVRIVLGGFGPPGAPDDRPRG